MIQRNVINMKIAEARRVYSTQIKAYYEQQTILSKQKKELEEKIKTEENGNIIYTNEAATLELTIKAVEEQKDKYQKYMDNLLQQWTAISNMEVAKQQGEAMEESVEDPTQVADNAEVFASGPAIVEVADTMASAVNNV